MKMKNRKLVFGGHGRSSTSLDRSVMTQILTMVSMIMIMMPSSAGRNSLLQCKVRGRERERSE